MKRKNQEIEKIDDKLKLDLKLLTKQIQDSQKGPEKTKFVAQKSPKWTQIHP